MWFKNVPFQQMRLDCLFEQKGYMLENGYCFEWRWSGGSGICHREKVASSNHKFGHFGGRCRLAVAPRDLTCWYLFWFMPLQVSFSQFSVALSRVVGSSVFGEMVLPLHGRKEHNKGRVLFSMPSLDVVYCVVKLNRPVRH